MKKVFYAAFLAMLVSSSANAINVTGAGASFPYPLYSKWAFEYAKSSGDKINYQSTGSGAGVRQIKSKTVDFAGSDQPLSPDELEKEGLIQFPAVIGGVSVIYNLDINKQLNLSGPVLAKIFLKKITKWDDPEILELNPGLELPHSNITVVRRSDSSGTTFIWTNYLSKVSDEWRDKVGFASTVNWFTGTGAKGNEGVANLISRLRGSIGYAEYSFAKSNNIPSALIKNQSGNFINPEAETFKAAASSAQWDYQKNAFGEILTDAEGENSYPITALSFVIVRQDEKEETKATIDFYKWAFENGQKYAQQLDYVALPESVVGHVKDMWAQKLQINK